MVGFTEGFLWAENLGAENPILKALRTCIPALLTMKTHVSNFFSVAKCIDLCTPKTGTRRSFIGGNDWRGPVILGETISG